MSIFLLMCLSPRVTLSVAIKYWHAGVLWCVIEKRSSKLIRVDLKKGETFFKLGFQSAGMAKSHVILLCTFYSVFWDVPQSTPTNWFPTLENYLQFFSSVLFMYLYVFFKVDVARHYVTDGHFLWIPVPSF